MRSPGVGGAGRAARNAEAVYWIPGRRGAMAEPAWKVAGGFRANADFIWYRRGRSGGAL